jgi:hypothetical protein
MVPIAVLHDFNRRLSVFSIMRDSYEGGSAVWRPALSMRPSDQDPAQELGDSLRRRQIRGRFERDGRLKDRRRISRLRRGVK